MANISRASIKKMVKKFFDVNITDDGADEIAKILEAKAREISKYAVDNAKRSNREKVTKEDIARYIIDDS